MFFSFAKNIYHFLWAFFSALFYGFPSQKIKVIGVTGTQGKSTVVDLAARILEEQGYKVASLSSIRFKIGKKEWLNSLKMTMPGRFGIQRFLKKALDSACKYAVLEVTSEGIMQHRQKFIDFDAAVFTNLSKEHIERHGSFENYKRAKGKLFGQTKKIHILNIDDKNADFFSRFSAKEKYKFTIKNGQEKKGLDNNVSMEEKLIKNRDFEIIKAVNYREKENGISFEIGNTEFNLKLLGRFNIYNALAAICAGLSQNISLETCKKALEKVKEIPGRMEVVISKPFKIIVDYAHTPQSLTKVCETLKNENKKLICVIGSAGGGRDKWKRPKVGEIAQKYCGEIIVTNEDPYDENPEKILDEIFSGFREDSQNAASIHRILDRREAIKKALGLAKLNDTVIITGKGCEPWMCVRGGKKIPWDDRKIAREEFQNLKNNY